MMNDNHFTDWIIADKGGPGSGHWGHVGRPGERGGSQPKQGIKMGIPASFRDNPKNFIEAVKYFGYTGGKGWKLHSAVSRIEYKLEEKNQLGELLTDSFVIEPLRENIGLNNFLTPEGNVDWAAYNAEFEKRTAEASISRKQMEDVLGFLKPQLEQHYARMRKKLGLPDDVNELLPKEAFLPENDLWGNQTRPDYEMLSANVFNRAKQIVEGIGFGNTSQDDLGGLVDFYQAQISNSSMPQKEKETGIEWLRQLEHSLTNRMEFEGGKRFSNGSMTWDEVENHGGRLDGRKEDWAALPGLLYHTTTDYAGVDTRGIQSRYELGIYKGPGLGGGNDKTISFGESLEVCKNIERAVHEGHLVASGKITAHDMIQFAKDGLGGVGDNWSYEAVRRTGTRQLQNRAFDPFNPENRHERASIVNDLLDYEDGKEVIGYSGTKWTREKYLDELWGYYHIDYMSVRQYVGGFDNPLFFSTDYQKLAKLDPHGFRVLQYVPASRKARGHRMSSLTEWRVIGNDAVKHRATYDFFDADDIDLVLALQNP